MTCVDTAVACQFAPAQFAVRQFGLRQFGRRCPGADVPPLPFGRAGDADSAPARRRATSDATGIESRAATQGATRSIAARSGEPVAPARAPSVARRPDADMADEAERRRIERAESAVDAILARAHATRRVVVSVPSPLGSVAVHVRATTTAEALRAENRRRAKLVAALLLFDQDGLEISDGNG